MIETLRQYYKILLNRDMNALEIERTTKMLEAVGKKDFDLARYRESILRSTEFCLVNRDLFYGSLFPRSAVVVAKTPLGQDIYVDIRELHLGASIAQGNFEIAETNFVKRTIRRGDRVCDIGANVGYFSLMFAALCGPSGAVTAFEPVSVNFDRLCASINLNHFGHVIKPVRAAVADRAGSVEIVSHANSLNSGSSHIRIDGPGLPHEVIERVASVTIDETLGSDRIDFIKIDVEGAEYRAMRGAESLLRRCKPTILMEFNDAGLRRISSIEIPAMLDYMTSFGYTVNELCLDGSTKPITSMAEALPRLLARSGIFNAALIPR